MAVRYPFSGRTANELASSAERAIRRGALPPGTLLPPVRALAREAGVSPGTAASAYRSLAQRGLVSARGRAGTRVLSLPEVLAPSETVPPHLLNVADGNPDPDLLPRIGKIPLRVPRIYGESQNHPGLVSLAEAQLRKDGIPEGGIAILSGAMDAIERVLQAHLRPGDAVAVEDPGYTGVLDLLAALRLEAKPVRVRDDDGPDPSDLEAAFGEGARAFVVTPRAQNPTGAALSAPRAAELSRILARHEDVLLVEDDHAGPVSGWPAVTLASTARRHWAVVRSVSKSLGPDLRLAVLTGDEATVSRVRSRQALGSGWVSLLLQEIVFGLWSDPRTRSRLVDAEAAYTSRREDLVQALARKGIKGRGRSGLNVWIGVDDEAGVAARLADLGWAVRRGERYRVASPGAIRITVSRLRDPEAMAGAMAQALRRAGGSPLP